MTTDFRQGLGESSSGATRSMPTSFLEMLNRQDPDAWRRLVRVFYPTVRQWCRRAGLTADDGEDVAQEVFRALAGGLERFDRDGGKNSFRGWLYGITRRQLLAHWKRQKEQQAGVGVGGSAAQLRLAEVPEPADDSSSSDVASEQTLLLRRAMALLQSSVEPRTWQAFWRVAVDGQSANDVAADLGMTANAIYLIKTRLLRRLREEFGELLS